MRKIELFSYIVAIIVGLTTIISLVYTNYFNTDIYGNWNDDRALEILNTKLNGDNFPNLSPPLEHKIFGKYSLLYKNNESIVLAIETNADGNDCHVCAPYLSFFEFEKIEKGWKLIDAHPANIQTGSWGKIPKDAINIIQISNNSFAVMVSSSYLSNGEDISCSEIYTRISDRFKKVLSVLTFYSSPNKKSEKEVGNYISASISLIKKDIGLFDILITQKGTLRSDLIDVFANTDDECTIYADYDHKKLPKKIILEFNGNKYVRHAN